MEVATSKRFNPSTLQLQHQHQPHIIIHDENHVVENIITTNSPRIRNYNQSTLHHTTYNFHHHHHQQQQLEQTIDDNYGSNLLSFDHQTNTIPSKTYHYYNYNSESTFGIFEETTDDHHQSADHDFGQSVSSLKRPHSEDPSVQLRCSKKQSSGNSKEIEKVKPVKSSLTTKDSQSAAAKNRRERISERLKVLQELVPNGNKVDLVTMLEKAISYVKFLQVQVKVLATDEFWPVEGGKAPDVSQVKEAIDAILMSQKDKNSILK